MVDFNAERAGLEAPLDVNTRPLLRLARRVLGCDDLAHDAVQEALVLLWQADPPPRKPQSWLAQTVVHRSLHMLRTLGRRRTHECRAPSRCELSPDPSQRLEHLELGEVLAEAVRELPSEFREAFVLRELEQLDYAEIARRTRVPVGTVRSRIHRARRDLRRRLRGQLDDYLPQEPPCALG